MAFSVLKWMRDNCFVESKRVIGQTYEGDFYLVRPKIERPQDEAHRLSLITSAFDTSPARLIDYKVVAKTSEGLFVLPGIKELHYVRSNDRIFITTYQMKPAFPITFHGWMVLNSWNYVVSEYDYVNSETLGPDDVVDGQFWIEMGWKND